MNLNKKILAAAIVGGLFTTAAQAQVVISNPTPVPVTFASELVVPGAGLTLNNTSTTPPAVAGHLNLVTALRYSFSPGEVRHARIECTPNIRFVTGSEVSFTPGATGETASIGAVNGIGTNAIHFSITAGSTAPTAAATLTVNGDRIVTNTAGGSCTYSLYDQPSQAANGGPTGLITTVTGAYIAFAPSYTFTVPLTETATASVEANPSFTGFVAAGGTSATTARLAQFSTAHVANRLASGAAIAALSDLMVAPVHITVTGDFSAAAEAPPAAPFGAAALTRVWIAAPGNACSVTTGRINADLLSATSARFTIPTPFALSAQNLCFQPRAGVTIPTSTYSAVFTPTAASGFVTPPIGPRSAGEIIRDGTQLQAPLVQTPTGFISRIVLTNTGTLARPATWNFRPATGGSASEANTTYTGATTGTLNVPANGSIVVSLVDVLGTAATTFGGTPPRGVFTVNVAGPNSQIQGLYQIVNPANGAISNHVMVRPGSN